MSTTKKDLIVGQRNKNSDSHQETHDQKKEEKLFHKLKKTWLHVTTKQLKIKQKRPSYSS